MLVMLILLILASLGLPIFFVGAGWMLSRILPLSIAQAAILSACSFGAFVVGFGLITFFSSPLWRRMKDGKVLDYLYREVDEDDDDDEEGEPLYWEEEEEDKKAKVSNLPEIGREERRSMLDEKCPCGSGRKFKNCCGKKNAA